ncbi:MAG: ABC transporter ATP-binding protein [Oscillospiraceae bacterium]|nr:ABC transporter ATP-binding protein [Oscillospiraceae bacterium]
MSKPIIEVNNVSVKYITGDLRNIGFKEYVMKKLTRKYKVEAFMAVNGVSFTLEQGDMLGIIGTNGAGKSTLLKVVTKIMEPSTGYVKVDGKIAALLELASGFDGELNLKENAYLRGAMLGYTRKFMDEKYPEILAFSELQEYEQRPFKHLSSGMKSRIAFAIAAMVEPEILILDEVLSVGDGAFREKSEAKMRDIIKSGKATILVSHSIPQVRRMCNKVLWLDHGKQIAFGDTNELCDKYEEFLKTGVLPEI